MSEITSKKVYGNNVDFSTIEITSKNVRRNMMGFSISKITSKKVRGNNVEFSTVDLFIFLIFLWTCTNIRACSRLYPIDRRYVLKRFKAKNILSHSTFVACESKTKLAIFPNKNAYNNIRMYECIRMQYKNAFCRSRSLKIMSDRLGNQKNVRL